MEEPVTPGRARRRTRATTVILRGALAASLVLATAPTPARAAEPAPDLSQSIAADQPLATGRTTLTTGHIDIGPRYVGNRWMLLIHDGTQARPVWRNPDETLLRVSDAALQTVPDDPAYAFLGIEAGKRAYVVPQVQDRNVIWLGWNTQDPRVMQTVDRGATLTLLGVRGPGTLTTYLQSGNFAAPQPLWRSAEPKAQPFWVEVNTHTHANWVFSAPGVYLLAVQVSADLVDGKKVSATGTLRFAVGDATSADDAFAAEADTPVPAGQEQPAEDPAGAGDRAGGSPTLLIAALAGTAVALAAGLVVLLLRGRGARRRAERERVVASPEGRR
ncbi:MULTISPECIES: choice-of-anchor M domain-containing protein [unclassified Micromonospora]|uniref:choice-of-anchor M domain-containing protein n=1 Tax=unclassified Micromonospora TaxID=2617518 RepID=UPI001C21BCAB|nr:MULTISPECIES: choice-of-anchor M domain-containing protein [unclassified Micromonospora]MBU8861542.1 choice-of-anchor M domain-containing protein [Micromonospora sp. WMMB482]MDM4781110.1 choice-of-anchor M domain-containing protein [Micromonospora sp. b486]